MAYGGMANGSAVGAHAEDLLKQIAEQQAKEKAEQDRIAMTQRGAIMANNMRPDTMAGMIVGQLLGDALNRWMGSESGGAISNKDKSAGTVATGEMIDSRNADISDQLMKKMLPDQYNAKQAADMEAFIGADPSSVHVTDQLDTIFKKPKEDEDPYSFSRTNLGLLGPGIGWRR